MESSPQKFLTDIEISQSVEPRPLDEIAEKAGILPEELIHWGIHKAKVLLCANKRFTEKPKGKYVCVTAINPTPLGEGKSTTAVGLVQGLKEIGKNNFLCVR